MNRNEKAPRCKGDKDFANKRGTVHTSGDKGTGTSCLSIRDGPLEITGGKRVGGGGGVKNVWCRKFMFLSPTCLQDFFLRCMNVF